MESLAEARAHLNEFEASPGPAARSPAPAAPTTVAEAAPPPSEEAALENEQAGTAAVAVPPSPAPEASARMADEPSRQADQLLAGAARRQPGEPLQLPA